VTDNQCEATFEAMRLRARDRLALLRDLPAEQAAVAAWARDCWLEDPRFVRRAMEMQAWWAEHPNKRTTLLLKCPFITIRAGGDPRPFPPHEWRNRFAELLPVPSDESFEWWLERAEKLLAEIRAAVNAPQRGRPRVTEKRTEVFVELQVNHRRATVVAVQFGITHSQVTRIHHSVCDEFKVRPRPPLPSRLGIKDRVTRKKRADAIE
jgi:hypothetical protein